MTSPAERLRDTVTKVATVANATRAAAVRAREAVADVSRETSPGEEGATDGSGSPQP